MQAVTLAFEESKGSIESVASLYTLEYPPARASKAAVSTWRAVRKGPGESGLIEVKD